MTITPSRFTEQYKQQYIRTRVSRWFLPSAATASRLRDISNARAREFMTRKRDGRTESFGGSPPVRTRCIHARGPRVLGRSPHVYSNFLAFSPPTSPAKRTIRLETRSRDDKILSSRFFLNLRFSRIASPLLHVYCQGRCLYKRAYRYVQIYSRTVFKLLFLRIWEKNTNASNDCAVFRVWNDMYIFFIFFARFHKKLFRNRQKYGEIKLYIKVVKYACR